MTHIADWSDEPPEHPVIAELRARPGVWAYLWKHGLVRPEGWVEASQACTAHPRVQTEYDLDGMGGIMASKARWIPEAEWTWGRKA